MAKGKREYVRGRDKKKEDERKKVDEEEVKRRRKRRVYKKYDWKSWEGERKERVHVSSE